MLVKELQAIGLDIRVLSSDFKDIIIRDDDEDDLHSIRNKAQDLGLEEQNPMLAQDVSSSLIADSPDLDSSDPDSIANDFILSDCSLLPDDEEA